MLCVSLVSAVSYFFTRSYTNVVRVNLYERRKVYHAVNNTYQTIEKKAVKSCAMTSHTITQSQFEIDYFQFELSYSQLEFAYSHLRLLIPILNLLSPNLVLLFPNLNLKCYKFDFKSAKLFKIT